MKIAIVVLALLLGACAQAPKRTVTITKADGHSYVTTVPEIADPRIHADGTRMDWVELAVVKVNGGLPPPPKPQPVWACMGADLGTTGVGLTMGAAEANPLGLIALPVGLGMAAYAKKLEREGDPWAAKVVARAHCGIAVWNTLVILSLIL